MILLWSPSSNPLEGFVKYRERDIFRYFAQAPDFVGYIIFPVELGAGLCNDSSDAFSLHVAMDEFRDRPRSFLIRFGAF